MSVSEGSGVRDPSESSTVLFLGQTGVEKRLVAQRLREEIARRAQAVGVDPNTLWATLDFEDFLTQGLTVREFVQRYTFQRQDAWDRACARVVQAASESKARDIGLFLHGYYWYDGELFTNINLNALSRLNPTVVVTLIDDVYDVHSRIMAREEEFTTGASQLLVPQLLTWRWAEIGLGDFVARNVRDKSIPHLVLAVKHSASTLRQLLLERERLPVYASFPISRVRREPEQEDVSREQQEELRAEINEFRRRLRDAGFTVLDPLTIDELRFGAAGQLTPRWPVDDLGPMVPPEQEPYHERTQRQLTEPYVWQPLASEVNVQVSRRDFRMVDAAQAVATFRPAALTGIHSGGTREELRYAKFRGRSLAVVHDPRQDGGREYLDEGGPFGGQVQPAVFDSIDGLIEHLGRLQEARSRAFRQLNEPQAWTDRAQALEGPT
jgi:hypothetical protein